MEAIRQFIIDLSSCKSGMEIFDTINASLDLPMEYGKNLDALWDILTGIMYTPAVIVIKGVSSLPGDLQVYAEKILSVFHEAQEECGDIRLCVID